MQNNTKANAIKKCNIYSTCDNQLRICSNGGHNITYDCINNDTENAAYNVCTAELASPRHDSFANI